MYNSNFNDQAFKTAATGREFNKTIDDPCAIQQRGEDNNKKLKFITTNHRDLLDARQTMNFFSIGIKDQLFVPAEQMDDASMLRQGNTGNVITNCNIKNSFGQLPLPTLPSRYQLYHGDVEIEDTMRNNQTSNRNSCNPRDTELYKRHFYMFDDAAGIETPNGAKSVETSEFGPRGGVSTRFPVRATRRP